MATLTKKTIFPAVKTFPCDDLNQLHPSVKLRAQRLIALCAKNGIQIRVTQTYRSTEYQNQLHAKNPTGAAPGGLSMHEFHCAFDVCIRGKDPYNIAKLNKVGALGVGLGLTWGGNFTKNGKPFKDRPHFQYTGKYTQAQIRNGAVPV